LADPVARILVGDDELFKRDHMVRTLARSSEVVAAAGAVEATAVLERWTADVLVTDLSLGEPDGVALARAVRARWPAMRIIVVTGFDDDPALIAARADGTVDDIVGKPWSPAALRTRVLALVVPR
jgi:CheY-like chemotaxis protein